MRRARQRRTVVTIAASVAAHVAVLGVVAIQAPQLRIPDEPGGPPTPIIPILILPKAPPSQPGGPPTPVQLHRRAPRHAQAAPPIAPLVTTAAKEPARPAAAPSLDGFRVRDEPPGREVQTALRGRVGCANPDAANLSRAERVACEELLGAGARDAPFPGLGIDRDKARELDASAARREADYRYKRLEPRMRPRNPGEQLEWDDQRSPPAGDPHLKGMGGSAKDYGGGKNDRSEAKVPF